MNKMILKIFCGSFLMIFFFFFLNLAEAAIHTRKLVSKEIKATRWQPTPGTSWQIQFSGTINTSVAVKAFDLDLFDTPQATIDLLHKKGIKVICYFSAGTAETWRPDYSKFPSSVKGTPLDSWANEFWLDVKNLSTLMPIMTARMNLAVTKHCDALDLDNVDAYTYTNSGFPLSYFDQLAYNTALANEAHLRNLSVGLKNDLEQINDLINIYDFAINESCWDYSECDYLKPFVKANKAVFGIEYALATSAFCSKANALNFDFIKKRLSLNAYRVSCR